MAPEQQFLHDLKKTIELEDEKNSRKPSQTYKPSSMNCIRNMYYQVTGTDPDTTGGSNYTLVGICNSGTDIHIRTQTAIESMKSNGIDCEYIDVAQFVKQRKLKDLEIKEKTGMETKLYHKKLNMSFMCDGIIKYKNHYYILEVKTETSSKWWSREGVDEKHYKQGTAYSIAFGIDEVIFLYINRDVLDMKTFLFVPTDEMKEELIGTIEECDEYVKKLITPPKPDNVLKKTCEFCSYRERCRKER
jgi:CRISPR/Cas system-associated exonuclease Cas4 (RecB family)